MPLTRGPLLHTLLILHALATAVPSARAQDLTRVRSRISFVCTEATNKVEKSPLASSSCATCSRKLLSIDNVSTPIPLQILVFKYTKGFNQVVPFLNGKPREILAGVFQATSDMDFIAVDLLRSGVHQIRGPRAAPLDFSPQPFTVPLDSQL